MALTVIRSAERDLWRDAALTSRQSFPATGNFDLAAGAFGLLMVHNDDTVAPGEGFDMHSHDNVEIITWVVEGRLRHRDNGSPTATELGPGCAQHISAGSGVRHSEVNAAGYTSRETVRVVQSWLPADQRDTPPFHASHDFTPALLDAPLVPAAGPSSPLPLGTAGAALWAGRPGAGTDVPLPQARYLHVYVIRGRLSLAGVDLDEGDVARLVDHGPVTARALADTELLVWAMDRALRD